MGKHSKKVTKGRKGKKGKKGKQNAKAEADKVFKEALLKLVNDDLEFLSGKSACDCCRERRDATLRPQLEWLKAGLEADAGIEQLVGGVKLTCAWMVLLMVRAMKVEQPDLHVAIILQELVTGLLETAARMAGLETVRVESATEPMYATAPDTRH